MKINGNDIKGIIFDLDGTLYNRRFISLNTVLYNLPAILLVKAVQDVRKMLRGVDFGNKESFYKKLFTELASETNKHFEYIKDWYLNKYCVNLISMLEAGYKPREQLRELLLQLRKRNMKLAVLSDYPFVKKRLTALKINPELFDFIKSSEEYGVLKPSPRSLNNIASLMKLDNNEILVVGDRYDTDIKGAIKAGMHYIQINEKESNPQNNTFIWEDFTKLLLI